MFRCQMGVSLLADAMKDKLDKKRAQGFRSGFRKDVLTQGEISELLREHVEKGDPVDVANFCMMLHARGERIV